MILSKSLLILVFSLSIIGLVVLSSAGIVEGQKKFNNSQYFLYHQFFYGFLPGIFLFLLASKISYNLWKKASLPILLLAIALVMLVFMPDAGIYLKGARRWIGFIGFSFQPSEFLKFALILYLAAWFSQKNRNLKYSSYSLLPLLLILGFISLLLILQPDFGTLALILGGCSSVISV